jgi:hypothetical protein
MKWQRRKKMPKYEYTLSLKYTLTKVIEAKDEQEAYDLACATHDHEILDDATGAVFNAICEGEVQDA